MEKDAVKVREELTQRLMGPLFRALDAHGITDDELARKLREELDATEVKVFQHQGSIVRSEPMRAWDIQQRARQDAHRLRGDYPAEKYQHEVDIAVEVVNYSEVKKEE